MQISRPSVLIINLLAALIVGFAIGCGSSTPSGLPGTTITVNFTGGTPLAVAQQTGTGAFTAMTPGNQITITVPSETTKYEIAYVCPPDSVVGTAISGETIIEATTQDPTTFSAACSIPPATGHATGSVNASLIAGATDVNICGNQGCAGTVGGVTTTSFDKLLPTGTNDIAAVAIDGSKNVVGVKMVRSQTVPGAVNNGSTIFFAPGDATTTQSITVNNVPAGFATPSAFAAYHTANGTLFFLTNSSVSGTNPEPYSAVPAAAAQSGDFYLYASTTIDTATFKQSISITQVTTSGGATTLSLPAPWSFSGPAAAKFPTFTFVFSGFSGLAAIADQGSISWSPGAATFNVISVTATANFQNGSTTVMIPDLTSLSGFLAPAATGTTINWTAAIFGGTTQRFAFFPNPPANGSIASVQNRGSFTQP